MASINKPRDHLISKYNNAKKIFDDYEKKIRLSCNIEKNQEIFGALVKIYDNTKNSRICQIHKKLTDNKR